MLDATKLATLGAVIEHGSFSAAGKALGLTQPAVSRQVALLEQRLGTELVRRSRRGVQPTEAGRILAGHAQAVADRLARAEADIAELAGPRPPPTGVKGPRGGGLRRGGRFRPRLRAAPGPRRHRAPPAVRRPPARAP